MFRVLPIALLLAGLATGAQAATLTVCNATDTSAAAVFFDPVARGIPDNRAVPARSCTAIPGIPPGEYKVSLYMGSDCFRPVSIEGDVAYTFDQAAKAVCDKEEDERLDAMYGP